MEPVANDNRRPLSRRERGTRAPLVERKRVERTRARGRARALTAVPLTEAQRAHDPLVPSRRVGSLGRFGWVLLVVVGSVLVHGGILGLPFLIGGRDDGRRRVVRQEVKIEVAEKKVEPPPPPVEPPPEPERRVRPKVVEPQKAPEPKAPPSKAPPRVVGLSLESTIEGGEGSGPSFAVGNTREGRTDDKARNPQEVPKEAPPEADIESKTNRVAARIPVAGVKYEPPKRKRPLVPPYPETLKSQGIEADVTVMISIDADGKVTSVKIIRPSEYPEFNELAKKTALGEEYEPATKDGVPMPFTTSFTYRWRLDEQ